MPDQIALIQGHPDASESHFCHALADAYRTGAEGAGHMVEVIDVGALDISLLRRKSDFEDGASLPWVEGAQGAIAGADHVVVIFPLWMGTMPAALKAALEWIFTYAFAFEITDKGWKPKLKGRSARIIVTMGMPAIAYRWYFFAHGLKNLERGILGLAGFSPIRSSVIGSVDSKDPAHRTRWLDRVEALGAAAR